MRIAAIDPGPTQSALVVCETYSAGGRLPKILEKDIMPNETVLATLGYLSYDLVLVERVAPYGQRAIGWETIETCEWGSYFHLKSGREPHSCKVTRVQVKLALFGTTQRITDSAIRDEIIHRYGGKETAIGKKKTPGPLYGLKADLWQAFALIIAWPDLKQDERTD